eukprot:6359756-Lingulodinium_polyedra.AAC.1
MRKRPQKQVSAMSPSSRWLPSTIAATKAITSSCGRANACSGGTSLRQTAATFHDTGKDKPGSLRLKAAR